MAIGERIRFFRNLRGMTQKYLGQVVGFPEKTADIRMAQYESGSRTPKAELTESLASALGVSPLALSVPDSGGVVLVPAFTGLGAPYWDMYARGAIVGLTRGSNKAHIARATLEGIAYQVKDLIDAMQIDAESPISVLRVDGGASVSSFLMQFQADMLRVPIDRPKLVETTAFGAAFLAGLASGVWESVDDIALLRQSDRIFKPEMDAEQAKQQHDNWLRAVGRAEKWSLE